MNKLCKLCKTDVGFMYVLTTTGYSCISCHINKLETNKKIIESMKDVDPIPPIDGKYRNGIIASTEESAKMTCQAYYEATPGFMDVEQ